MFIKITGLITLLCFSFGLMSCYSQYLLNKDEWSGGGKVMRIITNDGKLVELKALKGIEDKLKKKKVKGREWDPVLKTWSDREVSLSEVRYLWVEQIDAGRTILCIIGLSTLLFAILAYAMDWIDIVGDMDFHFN
jgi:hypothetical protein